MKILIFLSIIMSLEMFSRYGGGLSPLFFIYSIYFPLKIFPKESPKVLIKFYWSFLAYTAFWEEVFFSFSNISSSNLIFYNKISSSSSSLSLSLDFVLVSVFFCSAGFTWFALFCGTGWTDWFWIGVKISGFLSVALWTGFCIVYYVGFLEGYSTGF